MTSARAITVILGICALATLSWFLWQVDAVGGRPLTTVWSADPGVYDPHNTSHPIAQDVFRHVCEPLFYEDFDGQLRGLLAEDDVTIDSGGRRVTVRARNGIRFHDGASLNGGAVVNSFERMRRLGVSPLAGDLRDVGLSVGADENTVTFELPEPNYEFARLVLANPYAAIVSPRVEDVDAPGFVACTGPYAFAEARYAEDRSLTLLRWPAYEASRAYFDNRGAAEIPQMHFEFVSDRDARFSRLVDGDGCVLSVSREQLGELADRPDFDLLDATGGVTYVGFNFQRARWQDRRARAAIAHALDKAALAGDGPFLVADTPLTPAAVGFDDRAAEARIAYDPARSRALLRESGFDTDAEIVVLVPVSSTYEQLSDKVLEQLAAVGLTNVRVKTLPRADILSQRQDFDLLLFDYAWGDFTALAIFLGPGPRNLLSYPERDVAGLVQQALGTADPRQRSALVLEAQQTVLREALWQPLLVRRITFAADNHCVRGVRQSPEGELVFHDAVTAPFDH